MGNSTRFDLSRLEGCTGTISNDRVAVPHALRPARPDAPPGRDEGRSTTAAPPPTAPREKVSASNPQPQAVDSAPPVAGEAAPVRGTKHASPVRRSVRSRPEAESGSPTGERLPIGIIIALTLTAWIPVLLLWSSRIG